MRFRSIIKIYSIFNFKKCFIIQSTMSEREAAHLTITGLFVYSNKTFWTSQKYSVFKGQRDRDVIRTDVEGAGGSSPIQFKLHQAADLLVMSQPKGHTQDYTSCKLQHKTHLNSVNVLQHKHITAWYVQFSDQWSILHIRSAPFKLCEPLAHTHTMVSVIFYSLCTPIFVLDLI